MRACVLSVYLCAYACMPVCAYVATCVWLSVCLSFMMRTTLKWLRIEDNSRRLCRCKPINQDQKKKKKSREKKWCWNKSSRQLCASALIAVTKKFPSQQFFRQHSVLQLKRTVRRVDACVRRWLKNLLNVFDFYDEKKKRSKSI